MAAHREAWHKLIDLDGRELAPASNAMTRAIALVFVLPDCPICNSYIPELNRLHDEFGGRGVQLILANADTTTHHEAAQHVDEYQIKVPVVLDARHEWVRKAGVSIAPEAAVFSRDGELLYRGRIDNRYADLGKRRAVVTSYDLRDALQAILAGQPIKAPRTQAIGCTIPIDKSKD
jgi:hypothetical protein